jgi:hypothetical protein
MKMLSVLLILLGAGVITVAVASDLVGVGHEAGFGRGQIALAVAGFAVLLCGSLLAIPAVQRRLARFIAKRSAKGNDSEAGQSTSSLPGVILGVVLLALSILLWPGFLGRIVSLDWKIGNVRPVAYGLEITLAALGLASILGRRWVSTVWARLFPTRKELVFACVALTVSICLTLLVLEAGLRIVGKPFTEDWEPQEYARAQFDPEIGWVYKPNQLSSVTFVSGQAPVPVYHNELGARVRAPGTHFDPAKPTLILVGCSYTMGFGLPYEETFPGYLESMPGFPLQVVNLGVEGYGTDQSLLMLERYFDDFNTKAVVYTYTEGQNDRNWNYDRRVLHPTGRFVGTKPLFALRRDGTLYLKKEPLRYQDLSWSRVWAYVQLAWQSWGPEPPFDLTYALVREMKDYVEARGATFIVVDWAWPESGVPDGLSAFEGTGVNLIDTDENAPPGWGKWNSEWRIPDDSHPSAKAHARVAQLIHERLKDLIPGGE